MSSSETGLTSETAVARAAGQLGASAVPPISASDSSWGEESSPDSSAMSGAGPFHRLAAVCEFSGSCFGPSYGTSCPVTPAGARRARRADAARPSGSTPADSGRSTPVRIPPARRYRSSRARGPAPVRPAFPWPDGSARGPSSSPSFLATFPLSCSAISCERRSGCSLRK